MTIKGERLQCDQNASGLTFRYNFSSNVSGRINCGILVPIGPRGTDGATALGLAAVGLTVALGTSSGFGGGAHDVDEWRVPMIDVSVAGRITSAS